MGHIFRNAVPEEGSTMELEAPINELALGKAIWVSCLSLCGPPWRGEDEVLEKLEAFDAQVGYQQGLVIMGLEMVP